MLPSSVRRVVSSASQTPFFASHSLCASSPKAAAATAISISRGATGHQRRFSSSKPSSPDNGPKDVPSRQSVHASTSSRSDTAKTGGEKRKRKKKPSDEKNDPFQRLPWVPSTQHLSQEALGLSTFFSLHRPISITHSLPKSVSDEAFGEIFAARASSNNVTDVIGTLSRTVEELEGPMAQITISPDQEGELAGDSVRLRYPDGRESSVFVQVNSMSGRFLPFQPPPPPKPQASGSEGEAAAQLAEDIIGDAGPQHRCYKATFTIEESKDADGNVHVVAHSPKIIQRYIDRVQMFRHMYERANRRRIVMHAISVRRQKKLKMKKKKYKKLMRRTRNLRRKLDRL